MDDANFGGQIKVGTGIFPAIGEGITRVNGSAGIEGPVAKKHSGLNLDHLGSNLVQNQDDLSDIAHFDDI